MSAPILGTTCQAQFGRRIKDYNFTVSGGVVNAEDETRIQEAEVMLEVNGPVYDGVTLVKTVQAKTNDSGVFVFAYLSHKRGVKYTITVRKPGFEPVTVSGNSPPEAKHVIRLKRTETNASPPQS